MNVDGETRSRLWSLSFSGCVGLDPSFMLLTCQTTLPGQWRCVSLYILVSASTAVCNSIHWVLTRSLPVLSHLICVVDDSVLILQEWWEPPVSHRGLSRECSDCGNLLPPFGKRSLMVGWVPYPRWPFITPCVPGSRDWSTAEYVSQVGPIKAPPGMCEPWVYEAGTVCGYIPWYIETLLQWEWR